MTVYYPYIDNTDIERQALLTSQTGTSILYFLFPFMRMTDQQLDAVFQKQYQQRMAQARIDGVDHSEAEEQIARKFHLLIHP